VKVIVKFYDKVYVKNRLFEFGSA